MATTLSSAPQQTSAEADWHRIFESLSDEHYYTVDEVDGQLPAGLAGTLYRNGPGKNEVGGKPYAHLFDGDGLLSQFTFDGKQVHYKQPVRAHRRTTWQSARPTSRCCATTASSARVVRWATRSGCRQTSQTRASSTTRATCSLSARADGRGNSTPTRSRRLGEYDYDGKLGNSVHVLRTPDLGSRDRRALQLRHPVRTKHEAAHVPGRHPRQAPPPAARSASRSRPSTTIAR